MSRWRQWLGWAAQPIAIAGILFLALNGWQRTFTTPVSDRPGALAALAQAKAGVESDRWWVAPGSVDVLVVRTVGLATSNIVAAANIGWLLMVLLSGATAAWCLRRLGVSPAGAWAAGVLFALNPFTLSRAVAVPTLTPYLVPFAVTVALRLATDPAVNWRSRDTRVQLLGCVLLGLNAGDYAVFGVFLTLLGAIAGIVRAGRRAGEGSRLLTPAAIALCAFISVAPSVGAAAQADPPSPPWLSEFTGLKIRHLVSPLPDHWLPLFRAWTSREAESRFPYETDNADSRLGVVATGGFIGLMLVLLVPAIAGPRGEGETIRTASGLTLASVLVATVGGLGTVVAVVAVPAVRALHHITPFIAFFALVALALWLDRLTSVHRMTRRLAWIGVLVIGLADQTIALRPMNADVAGARIEFRGLRSLVEVLDQRLPPGSRVFQLPNRSYSAVRGVARMRPHEHLKPLLVSRHLRWSYPNTTEEHLRAEEARSSLDLEAWPMQLAKEGYSAVLLDRLGYPDNGDAALATLLAAPGQAGILAQTARYVAIDLR